MALNDTFYDDAKNLNLASQIEFCTGMFGYDNTLSAFETVYTPSLNDKLYFLKGVTIFLNHLLNIYMM